jgi:hypothetical protein
MAGISNNEIKRVKALQQKKVRDTEGLFIVEGEKMVQEAVASPFDVVQVYHRSEIGEEAMVRISALASPSPVLAVVRKPADMYVDDAAQQKIAKWLGNRFWLYNNKYGNNFAEIIKGFETKIEENELDLLVLDNLMAFDISDLGNTKWDAQTQFVLSLTELAKRRNIHIAFVAHPRKSMGFLRFDDISGSGDLGNAVDDAFIVHRNNNDFKRFTKDMFGWKEDNPIYEGTNVVEIVKDRDGGNQDVFIPLYYETETKRLKNEKSENIIYGWCSDAPEEQLPTLADFKAVEDDLSGLPFD